MKRLFNIGLLLLGLCLSSLSLKGQMYVMGNNGTITTCAGTFYDPGGTNNYSNNLDVTQTIVAGNGECLKVTFTSFQLESNRYDYLIIYDGPNTQSTQIGAYSGSESPGVIQSTFSSLTFVFHSDGSLNYSGWVATISCCEPGEGGGGGGGSITTNCVSTDVNSPCFPDNLHPFCTDENPYGVTYHPGTEGNASNFFGVSSNSHVGCLYNTPAPAWYFMQIDHDGSLIFDIQATLDVDFACWGPFHANTRQEFIDSLCCGYYVLNKDQHGNNTSSTEHYPYGNLVDCSYSANHTETCHIPNAHAGEWYLLLLTNYSRVSGTITFTSSSSSTATTNCSLLAPITSNGPLCEGGTLELTCQNPVAGATYNWSGPGGWTATTTVPTVYRDNVSVSDAGSYTLNLIVENQNVNPSTVDVVINSYPNVVLTATYDTICRGTQTTLRATGATTYTWNPAGTTAAQRNVSPTATTTYIVTGTANGCSSSDTLTIVVNPKPVITVTIDPISNYICNGDTAEFIASGAETYVWRKGTTIVSTDSNLIVSPSQTTSYTVTGTSTEGCTNTLTRSIQVRQRPTVTVQVSPTDHTVCLGDTARLTANGCANYQWFKGNVPLTFNQIMNVTPTDNTNYTVIGTAVNGCTDTMSVDILVAPIPQLEIVATPANRQICSGDSAVLSASGAQDYIWLAISDTIGNDDLLVTSPIQSTEYKLIGISPQGCYGEETLTIIVNENPQLSITCNPQSHGICIGDTARLSVSGATNYQWIQGESLLSAQDNLDVYPLQNSDYKVVGTTLEGCQSIDSITVFVYPLPEISLTVVPAEGVVCNGGDATLTASGAATYTWWNNDNLLVSLPVLTINPTQNTVYTVIGTSGEGCTSSASQQLLVHNVSPESMNAETCDDYEWNGVTYTESGTYTYIHDDLTGCEQVDTLHLIIHRAVHHSEHVEACVAYEWHDIVRTQSGTYLYAFNDANGCQEVDTLHLTITQLTPETQTIVSCEPFTWHNQVYDQSGVYLYPHQNEYGCDETDTLKLRITAAPEITITQLMNATCNENNGEVKVEVDGGLEPLTYTYQPQGVPAVFDNLAPGSYDLHVSDSIGCGDDVQFDIENIIHHVQLVETTQSHCGRPDASATIAVSGGYGEFTYEWPAGAESHGMSADHLPAGQHSVAVIDSNGCQINLPFAITEVPGPSACFFFSAANSATVTVLNCTQQNVLDWHWTLGNGTESDEWQPTVTYEGPGHYPVSLWVEDAFACEDSVTIMYVIQEVPSFYLPSAFIPESDIAENRVFKPIGNSISDEDYLMQIFDRYGGLVFTSSQPDFGWDGKINGKFAPQGHYAYQITYRDIDGVPYSRHGSVLLIR